MAFFINPIWLEELGRQLGQNDWSDDMIAQQLAEEPGSIGISLERVEFVDLEPPEINGDESKDAGARRALNDSKPGESAEEAGTDRVPENKMNKKGSAEQASAVPVEVEVIDLVSDEEEIGDEESEIASPPYEPILSPPRVPDFDKDEEPELRMESEDSD